MSAPAPAPASALSAAAASASAAVSAGAAAFHALSSQVGGHPGVLASADGALIIKTCLPRERAFYELLARREPCLEPLQPFVPTFYGTLRLEGYMRPAAAAAAAAAAAEGAQELSLVLENVTSPFLTPNILDIKLGTVLYDADASAEKRAHMLEAAARTTSLETGIRLTGFQVYNPVTRAPDITPKAYGRALTASDLPEGFRRFFPLSPDPPTTDTTDPNSATVPVPVPADATASTLTPSLPHTLLLPTLHGLLAAVRSLRAALAETEVRMVGASLLIVYEADRVRARQALLDEVAAAAAANKVTEGDDDDEMLEQDGYEEDDEGSSSASASSSSSSDEENHRPLYTIKLIDFAHTRLVPGSGPDEGVLRGLDTTIRLLEGRVKQVEAEVQVGR
ncbi:hypothetical protein M0805_003242 [Coniferiporia weirii]|nr:hypothetical protein M0805_003242 [Coniferiporia weirii]